MKNTLKMLAALVIFTASTHDRALAQAAGIPPFIDEAELISEISDAWVCLYDARGFKGPRLTVNGEMDVKNFDNVKSEDGQKGFGDRAASVRFQIPMGWKLVLFDHQNYKQSGYELKGTGKIVELSHLGPFSDKASSMRWERVTQ